MSKDFKENLASTPVSSKGPATARQPFAETPLNTNSAIRGEIPMIPRSIMRQASDKKWDQRMTRSSKPHVHWLPTLMEGDPKCSSGKAKAKNKKKKVKRELAKDFQETLAYSDGDKSDKSLSPSLSDYDY